MLFNLNEVFKNCNERYCILRMSESFPTYEVHSDIDVLCGDKYKVAEYIISLTTHIPSTSNCRKGNYHIDYWYNNQLDIKFDLIDKLVYDNIEVSDLFSGIVLCTRELKNEISIPNIIIDLAIRYMEYMEFRESRPEKIKHLNYVKKYDRDILNKVNDIIIKYTNIKELL